MNKSVMTAIFATGLAAAGWVGWGFIGHSPLALAMTVMIAATYLLGAWELMRYRAATASLTRALDAHQEPPALEAWLEGAQEHKGSWWTDWSNWLQAHAGKQIAAPKTYGKGAKFKAIEPAPGRYVKQKA